MERPLNKTVSRPTAGSGTAPAASKPQITIQRSKNERLMLTVLVLLLILSLLIGIGLHLKSSYGGLSGVKKDKYQALSLTNGQVYFGKLSQADSKTVVLKDIYYLQLQEPVQPKADAKTEAERQNKPPTLAKLGTELHAPEDAMYVDREQVLFWENLKDNGKVVKAIKDHKNKD